MIFIMKMIEFFFRKSLRVNKLLQRPLVGWKGHVLNICEDAKMNRVAGFKKLVDTSKILKRKVL